jgi:hypothetical protein
VPGCIVHETSEGRDACNRSRDEGGNRRLFGLSGGSYAALPLRSFARKQSCHYKAKPLACLPAWRIYHVRATIPIQTVSSTGYQASISKAITKAYECTRKKIGTLAYFYPDLFGSP